MRFVCPSCGAVHSWEAWSNDEAARDALKIACRLPEPVCHLAPHYLALFRSGDRGLQWRRAISLLKLLATLISSGWVRVERKVARECPVGIWGQAIEYMLDHPPSELPLKSHGYLTKVAYDLADRADRQREAIEAHRVASGENPHRKPETRVDTGPSTPWDGITKDDFRRARERLHSSRKGRK